MAIDRKRLNQLKSHVRTISREEDIKNKQPIKKDVQVKATDGSEFADNFIDRVRIKVNNFLNPIGFNSNTDISKKTDEIIDYLNNTNGFEIWGNLANKAEEAIDSTYTDRQNQEYEKDKAEREQRQQERLLNASGKGLLANVGAHTQNTIESVFQKPKAFYDNDGKLTLGDILSMPNKLVKAGFSSIASAGTHAVGALEDLGKAGTAIAGYGTSAIAGATGNEEFRDEMAKNTASALEEMNQFKSDLTGILDEESALGRSGNNLVEMMTFSKTLGLSGKKIGNALLLASGLGNSLEESYKQEDLEDWQRWLKGTGNAIIGYFAEQINDSFGFGGNGLSNTVKSAVMNKLQSGTAKFLARTALGGTFEAGEEDVEALLNLGLNYTINFITNLVGHGGELDTSLDLGDLVESNLLAFTSGIAGSENYNSQNINVNTAVKQMVSELEKKGYKVTAKDKRLYKEVALTARENAIAEDYKYASRDETIQDSKLSDSQKAELLESVRENNTNAKDLKQQIQEAEKNNKEIEKKIEEYNLPENQKQTLLEMTRQKVDNSDMNEIVDEAINENRKIDAEVNKQIQEIDSGKSTFEDIINRNQRLNANQKLDLIERYKNGSITDYEALKEVRYIEAENQQEKELSKIKNEQLLEQEQQSTLPEAETVQNEGSQETNKVDKILSNTNLNDEAKEEIREYFKDVNLEEISSDVIQNYVDSYKEAYDEKTKKNTTPKEKDILDTTETYHKGRREKYNKYMNDHSEYDNSALKNAKQLVPANKQGRRTKEQWLSIARQIGAEIADKSDAEIEKIAYKTWQDERPNDKSNLNRQGKKFVGFNSDEWINEIYNSVKQTRNQNNVDINQNTDYNNINTNIVEDRFSSGEINRVSSAINTDTPNLEKGLNVKEHGDYLYIFTKNSFDDYFFEGKIKIEGNQEFISNIREVVKNGNVNEESDIISQIVQAIENDGNVNNSNNANVENGQTSEGNDDIYSKQQGQLKQRYDNATSNENKQSIENSQDEGSFNLPQDTLPQATDSNEEFTKDFKENQDEFLYNDAKTLPRGFTKSAVESDYVAKEVKKTLIKTYDDSRGSYQRISNSKTINKANEVINETSPLAQYNYLMTKFDSNEKPTLQDIAVSELLIQHFSDIGDFDKATDLTIRTAILGTELGQMVQALSIINKSTPYARLIVAQKAVDRLSARFHTELEMNPELVKKVRESKTTEETDQALEDLYKDVANQLPLTLGERLDNWRYLAMLGNPKTWIRNRVGNTTNRVLMKTKNLVKGIEEDIVGRFWKDYVKDATFKSANEDQRNFAHEEAVKLGADIDNVGNKYSNSADNAILKQKRKFDNKALNSLAEGVEGILDKDDVKALVKMYESAYANYMSANNLSSEDLTILEDDSTEVRKKKEETRRLASEYASQQAKEATFHQANAVATWLNNLDKISQDDNSKEIAVKLLGTGMKGVLPFRRTPFNIASQGVMFSPAGILRGGIGLYRDIRTEGQNLDKQLKKGKITKAEYNLKMSQMVNNRLDQFAKGFTGTTIGAVLGYFLSSLGLVKAGNDDEEDEYEEKLGKQKYSLLLGDYSISLDWLVPSAMPLFMGVEFYDSLEKEGSIFTKIFDSSKRMLDVEMETTMLSSINNAIKYSDSMEDLMSNVSTSYLSQFIPSIASNIANTIDPYTPDYTSVESGVARDFDYMYNRLASILPQNTPLLRDRGELENKKEAYGEGVRQEGLEQMLYDFGVPNSDITGVVARLIENFVSPANIKEVKTDNTTNELLKVADDTSNPNLLKTSSNVSKEYKIGDEKYKFTNAEFSRAKGVFGKEVKSQLDTLVNSDYYKSLDDPNEKSKLINDIYTYGVEKVKEDYAKQHGLEFESKNKLYKVIKSGVNLEKYYNYEGATKDMETKAEKVKYLDGMGLSTKERNRMYEITAGSDDNNYGALKAITGDNVSKDYLNFYMKESDGDFKATEGKKDHRQKLENYINNSDMSNIERYYMYTMDGSTGYAKYLTQTQRDKLREAIEKNKDSIDEEKYESIMKRLDKADNGE